MESKCLLLELPLELQRKIVDQLYEPWHLRLEEVPARSRFPLYSITTSHKFSSSTLRVCRQLRDISFDVLSGYFTRILDARPAYKHLHSLMPKYKDYLHRVKTIQFGSVHGFTKTGQLYYTRLEDLDAFEIHQRIEVVGDAIHCIRLYDGEQTGWFGRSEHSDEEYEEKYRERITQGTNTNHEWNWVKQISSPITIRWREEINLTEGKRVVVSFKMSLRDGLALTDFEVTRHGFDGSLQADLSTLAIS